MAGSGPAPATTRRRRNIPVRGDWKPAPGSGWKHGPIPKPPDGLKPRTVEVWNIWMGSWWAANWTPEYLPQIEATILLYDQLVRGDLKAATELRQHMDSIGASFKGQQDRRWAPPKEDEQPKAEPETAPTTSRYAHLRAV